MTVYVDTSVIMYAGGRDHPLRRPCREVIRQVVAGDLDGVTSAEVVQEILHRFASSPQREKGIAMARATLDLFDHLLPVDRTMISAAVDLHEQYEDLSARDALHAAACMVHDVPTIVSTDTDFDELVEVQRLDPVSLG
jgi:uncharacterized protein